MKNAVTVWTAYMLAKHTDQVSDTIAPAARVHSIHSITGVRISISLLFTCTRHHSAVYVHDCASGGDVAISTK